MADVYATRWVITMFIADLPVDAAFSILDLFIFDGEKVIVQVILAMLYSTSIQCLSGKHELMTLLKSAPQTVNMDIEKFFARVLSINPVMTLIDNKDIPNEGVANRSPESMYTKTKRKISLKDVTS